MVVLVLSVGVALGVSFLCSLAEATLLSLTPSQVAEIAARRPAVGGIWRKFKANIERPISAILILNTTAHTVGAAMAGGQVDALLGSRWVGVFSAVFTFLMLQYTEILPKTLGVRYNRPIGAALARPLDWLASFLQPVIRLAHWINRPFERSEPPGGSGTATLEELRALAALARMSDVINAQEERIILGGARLSATPVSDLMIPMQQVTSITSDQHLMDAIITAHLDPHTRFPVRDAADPRKVIGYVNFKEMIYFMRTNPGDASLKGIIRPVEYVRAGDSASRLLRLFVEQHAHLAVVRDAEGNALGMVTMEDIVERLVGRLEDEFDRAPRLFHALTGGTFMIGGGMTMNELGPKTGMALPAGEETLSDWIVRRFGRLPQPGEAVREGDAEFQVRRVRRGKVFEVSLSRAGQPHPGMPPPPPAPGLGPGGATHS